MTPTSRPGRPGLNGQKAGGPKFSDAEGVPGEPLTGRAMAMRGWRRIGIIVSVIWFFGFSVFLWNKFVEDAVAPYA